MKKLITPKLLANNLLLAVNINCLSQGLAVRYVPHATYSSFSNKGVVRSFDRSSAGGTSIKDNTSIYNTGFF